MTIATNNKINTIKPTNITSNTQSLVVINQKGGVGKTTSVVNIASCLVKQNKKILVIDLDPQANTTTASGIEKNNISQSIYHVLLGLSDINDAIISSSTCFYDIIPANRDLAGVEIELIDFEDRELCLSNAIKSLKKNYDLILIDCPPSLSLLTINALTASLHLLVPIQCEYYALEGLTDLLNTIHKIKAKLNPNLNFLGLFRTMFDKRNKLSQQVSEQLLEHFKDKLFETTIPRNIRLAEAPSFGMSAVILDPKSIGAIAYKSLTTEILKRLQ